MLFPAPEGPTSATREPRGTEKDTPRSTSPATGVGVEVLGARHGVGVEVRVLEERERLGLRRAPRGDDGVGVAEVHVAELDRRAGWTGTMVVGVAHARRQRGVTLRLGRQIEDLLDAAEGAQRLVDRRDCAEGRSERGDQQEQEHDEGDQRGDGDRAGCDPEAADTEHDQQRQLQRDPRDRHDERRHLGDPHTLVVGLLGQPRDRGLLAVAGAGRAHGADRSDGSLHARRELAHLLLLVSRCRADPSAEQRHATDRQTDHEDDETQQRGVDERHRHEGADEDQAVSHGIGQPLGEDGVQQRRVGADPRDEIARSPRVELADRQVQDAPDQLSPRRVDHGSAGALQQEVLKARDDGCRDHQREDTPDEHAQRLARLHAVDEQAHQQRLREGRDRAEDAQDHDDHEHATMFEEEWQQLLQARARTLVRRTTTTASAGGGGCA